MIVKSLHFLRKPSFEALTVTRHGTYLVQPQAPGLAVDTITAPVRPPVNMPSRDMSHIQPRARVR